MFCNIFVTPPLGLACFLFFFRSVLCAYNQPGKGSRLEQRGLRSDSKIMGYGVIFSRGCVVWVKTSQENSSKTIFYDERQRLHFLASERLNSDTEFYHLSVRRRKKCRMKDWNVHLCALSVFCVIATTLCKSNLDAKLRILSVQIANCSRQF